MAAGDSYAGITVPEGDPEQLGGLAQSYSGLAGAVDSAAAVFDAFPSELSMWQGPASVAFAAASVMGGGGARSAGSMLDQQAGALRAYADDLEAAQRKAERAIDDARDAARRMREAEQMIDDARDRQSEANQRADGAELVLGATRAVGIDFGAAEAAKAQAERDAAEAAAEERCARRLLEQAIDDLEAAKRRGEEAEDEARTTAIRAAGALGAATPGGISGALGAPAGPNGGGAGLPLATLLPFALLGGGSGEKAFGELAPLLGFTDGLGGSTFGDRQDRRIANDDRMRIPSGGRTDRSRATGGDFESDWAGRELLERYLIGGDDLSVKDDPDWTRYMMANPQLTRQLNELVQKKALDAFSRRGSSGGTGRMPFDDKGSMEIQNGESISGWQYMHGTNDKAGGFRFRGSTEITRVDGGYEVHVPASYTWNDKIDPNPEYRSDRIKSTVAEVLTRGRADGYELHLTWSGDATVRLDEDGNVLWVRGYPGD